MQPCKKRCPGPEGAALWIDDVFFVPQVGAVPPSPCLAVLRACVCECNGIFFSMQIFFINFLCPSCVSCVRVCVCVRPCCCFLLLLFSFLFSFCFFVFSCVCVCFFCELFSNCQSQRFFWVVAKIFTRYETLHGAWGGPRQGRPQSGSGSGTGSG